MKAAQPLLERRIPSMSTSSALSDRAVRPTGFRMSPDLLERPLRFSRAWITIVPMILADAAAVACGCFFAVLLLTGMSMREICLHSVVSVPISLACLAVSRPYPGSFLHPAEEWRRIFWSIAVVVMVFGTICYFHAIPAGVCGAIGVCAWALAILVTIALRGVLGKVLARCDWWGVRTLIIAPAHIGARLRDVLRSRHEYGLKVVGWLNEGAPEGAGTGESGGWGWADMAQLCSGGPRPEYAVIAVPGLRVDDLSAMIRRWGTGFRRVFAVWDMEGISSLGVTAGSISDLFGVSVHQNLYCTGPGAVKRALDLLVAAALSLALLPLLAALWALVKLSSTGPAFYGQRRLGKGGKHFTVWKFRTMIVDADRVLADYLEKDPDLRREWLLSHKLKSDPRNTLIGRVLRKTSLDELPQLWNVLRGEMSLVGPRPIVDHEVKKYAGDFEFYQQVRPGVTGLWQVSGRNNTSYAERVALDRFYVRNWSVWLDLYILARTGRTVFTGHGAY